MDVHKEMFGSGMTVYSGDKALDIQELKDDIMSQLSPGDTFNIVVTDKIYIGVPVALDIAGLDLVTIEPPVVEDPVVE